MDIIKDQREEISFKTIKGYVRHHSMLFGETTEDDLSTFVVPYIRQDISKTIEKNKGIAIKKKYEECSLYDFVNLADNSFGLTTYVVPIECNESSADETSTYHKVLNDNNLALRDYSCRQKQFFSRDDIIFKRRDVYYKDFSKLRFRVVGCTQLYTIDNLHNAAKELKEGKSFIWFSDNGYSYMGTTPIKIEKVVEWVKELTSGETEFDDTRKVPKLEFFNNGCFKKSRDGVIELLVGKDKQWSEISNS